MRWRYGFVSGASSACGAASRSSLPCRRWPRRAIARGAVGAIAAAVADGSITPDEALLLSQMLDGFPRVLGAVAAASAAAARVRDDPREAFIAELDRLAARIEEERAGGYHESVL
jgi:hypothetical protein